MRFRLACGTGRAALARQALVVAGIAVASVFLLLATGIAQIGTTLHDDSAAATSTTYGPQAYVVTRGSLDVEFTSPYLAEPGLRVGVVLGFVLCVVPLLVFVAVASRVAARRRDERFAALRLAGATRRQVRDLALLDTLVGGVAGTVIGTVLYLLLRRVAMLPGLQADLTASVTTPSWWAGALVLVALLVALCAASASTLRTVNMSPLGVVRRGAARAPRPWGLVLLLVATVLLVAVVRPEHVTGGHAVLAVTLLVLVLAGLAGSGSWITWSVGGLLAGRTNGPVLLLAGRRLQDEPRAQARAMSAVVLVVLAATLGLGALSDALSVNDGSDDGFLAQGYGLAGAGMVFSLAVGASGLLLTTAEGLLERRRTLASLHAGGVPLSTLRKATLAQVALPFVPASLLAVLVGLVFSAVLFGTHTVVGLPLLALLLPVVATVVAVAVTSTTLPFLRSGSSVEQLRVS